MKKRLPAIASVVLGFFAFACGEVRSAPPTLKEQINVTQNVIAIVSSALAAYEVDTGAYPATLDALVVAPKDAKDWHGPYVKEKVPLDPWGHAYVYNVPGKQKGKDFDLLSYGPDGKPGGGDDIVDGEFDPSKL